MKNDKELAFLYDLYIAPDWNERFAGLIDEHIQIPKQGRVLYVEQGTGGHALEMSARAGQETEITATDSDVERIRLAQAKAVIIKDAATTDFHQSQPESLPFDSGEFDLVIANFSLISAVAPERLPEIITEMKRVTRGGGVLALAVTTRSSFGEFLSLYWEALSNLEDVSHAAHVETLVNKLPVIADVETLMQHNGVTEIQTWTNREEFEFASGAEFLASPLIENFLAPDWLAHLPDVDTDAAAREHIARLIDDERQDAAWSISIKATLFVGQRGE